MIFGLWTTLLGFILEFVILFGLIFDLYKWWLFIAMTTPSNSNGEGDSEFNEQIMNQTKSNTKVPNEVHKLEFKIKIYYAFIVIGSLLIIGALVLSIGFIMTILPDDLDP